jgi:two-component system chemotaxis sensor kinase CheA
VSDHGIDLEALLAAFRGEAEERFAEMEETLLLLAENPGQEELLHTLFRGAHTLKGDALTVGFTRLAELMRMAEDFLARVRGGGGELGGREAGVLLRALDVCRQMLSAGDQSPAGYDAVAAGLRDLAAGDLAATAPVAPAAPVEDRLGTRVQTLRVGIDKLDRLLDLIGEIGVARDRARQAVSQLTGKAAAEIVRNFEDADPLYLELQELVMRARLVPVAPAFRQQLRTLREAAAAVGKAARLEVEDNEVEVDAKVIEQIRAPLAHMVRNAVDHGLESEARRRAAGKPEVGTVTLRAAHAGATVVIEVADDGAGLDERRVGERAVAQGLLTEGASASRRELERLLFRPGFTTAEAVSDLSGRGVGLDVVWRAAAALRGTVEVDSRPGEGTTFRMRLPLTLAIIEGFAVAVGGETFILPLDAVHECVELPAAARASDGERGVLDLHGHALPFVRLRCRLAVADGASTRESVVVVEREGQRLGLVVDRLLGGLQAVVKPLVGGLRGLSGVFGTTILGDGRVALILDLGGLLRAELDAAAARSPAD